jgi:hypothetical protein
VVLVAHGGNHRESGFGQDNLDHAAVASTRAPESRMVLDVSLDSFFPDLLKGPKDDVVRMPRSEVEAGESRQRHLEEPLL